jgi:ATP-dependent Lon protease
MPGSKKTYKKRILPMLPLRGLTVFPHMILTFDVGREKSIKALDEAMMNNQLIFLTTQKDAKNDSPDVDDIYNVGTISRVKQLLRLPGNTIRVLVEGLNRAEVRKYVQTDPYFIAEVAERIVPVNRKASITDEALKRKVISTFED